MARHDGTPTKGASSEAARLDMKLVRKNMVDSTNEVAKVLVAEGAVPWTVVVAAKQLAGRGRFGRRWTSPRGGLYLSIALIEEVERLPLVTLAAGLSVAEVVEAEGIVPELKWPNDVFVEGAKIAGVLVEGLTKPPSYWGIVGFGINSNSRKEAFPRNLVGHITTLRHELGRAVDNDSLLKTLLASFRDHYPAPGREPEVVAHYRKRCTTLGRELAVETATGTVRGKALDISSAGLLVVELADGSTVEVAEGTIVQPT